MERISELVVGDLPALGDGGDQVAVRVRLDEALKHVEQHLAVRGGDGGVGVKAVFQILRDADDDLVRVAPRVGRVGVPAAGGEGESHRCGQHEHKARRSGKKTREGVPFARLVGVGVRDELIVELAYGAGQNFMLHSIPP